MQHVFGGKAAEHKEVGKVASAEEEVVEAPKS